MIKQVNKFHLILFLLMAVGSFAQVGINTKNPNANTFLHVSELNDASLKSLKGTIVPRYSLTQRNSFFTSLAANDNGLLIYNTTENCFNYWSYQGGAGNWKSLCDCPILENSFFTANCSGAVVANSPLNTTVNYNGIITLPITVVSNGTIAAIYTTINGLTFSMPATAVTTSTTTLTINYKGQPTSSGTISLPITTNNKLTICNVAITVN